MFAQFMQMGGPAAFAILSIVFAPIALYLVVGVNRNFKRGQEIDYQLKLQDKAHQARQIEAKKNA